MTDQETFSVNFAGRDILFHYPIPAQLIMLRRRVIRGQQRFEASTDLDEKLALESQLIADTLDVVETLIVNGEDVEFIEKEMLHGKIDHVELMDVLRAKREEDKPAPRKRAATKATANRGRTKR